MNDKIAELERKDRLYREFKQYQRQSDNEDLMRNLKPALYIIAVFIFLILIGYIK